MTLLLVVELVPVHRTLCAADRSADEILREIDALKLPVADPTRDDDREYVKQFWREHGQITRQRAALIGALARVAPKEPRLAVLLPYRWRTLSGRMMGSDGTENIPALMDELDQAVAANGDHALQVEASYIRAWVVSDPLDRPGAAPDAASKVAAINRFVDFAPHDERGAQLYMTLAKHLTGQPAQQRTILERISRGYPATQSATAANGLLAKLESVGKPFDLTFRDATTNAEVATRRMMGKVLVIDFWATWCGPCVADIPRLKQLHQKYQARGVEFIGVSLDQAPPEGSLADFRAFVADRGISWPQFYQGNGWESAFSTAQGITAVPTLFVIDPEGKIASTDAGEDLEALLKRLIDRPSAAPAALDGK